MASKPKIQSVKGMHDILPDEQKYWHFVLKKAVKIAEDYRFSRIDTPIVENSELFIRTIGEGTDIIEKEIYSFKTKGGDPLSLRPEGTAGIARAYIEQGMGSWPHPVKLYYFGPMFRHDQPQAGRFRQFYQFGVESLGEESSVVDAEIILLAFKFLNSLGIKNIVVKINSIGDQHCRPQFIKVLKDYFRPRAKKLCVQCKERIKSNILRVLDCKEAGCQEASKDAPQFIDYLDQNCKSHFKSVLEFLDEVKIPYLLDPFLVRGLDYYTRTVFEIMTEEKEGEKNLTLIAGGRYDKLAEQIGGAKTPSAGWAAGAERIISEIKNSNISVADPSPDLKIFVAQLGEAGKRKGLSLFEKLRQENVRAASSLGRDSIKSQLRIAHRLGVKFTLIVGQKEALDGTVILRDMESGIQETLPTENIVEVVKKRLK